MDRSVYSRIDMRGVCEETLDLLARITEADLYSAAPGIPTQWLSDQDWNSFPALLAKVQKRRKGLRELVFRQLKALDLELIRTPLSGFASIPNQHPCSA
jgi:hypothetical protein